VNEQLRATGSSWVEAGHSCALVWAEARAFMRGEQPLSATFRKSFENETHLLLLHGARLSELLDVSSATRKLASDNNKEELYVFGRTVELSSDHLRIGETAQMEVVVRTAK
jgi:hypothetical protein